MRPSAPLIGGNVLRSLEMASNRRLFGGIDEETQRKTLKNGFALVLTRNSHTLYLEP